MNKIIIVCGPTSSGKTAFAIKLAKEKNGELINADSRQIYKYLDIGTNKLKGAIESARPEPTEGEFEGNIDDVRVHLLSFLNPDERFSVFDFKKLAEEKIEELIAKGKQPILVGGTGLYIDAIVKNYQPDDYSVESAESKAERSRLEKLSVNELQAIALEKQILDQLNESDRQNPRRLIRLIEKGNSEKSSAPAKYEFEMYYPKFDWDELKAKIENRVDEMFKEGIVEETKKVLEMGFPEDSVALQGIGYREVLRFLRNEISLPECIQLVKTAHTQYAKRQITWFEGKGRGYQFKFF